jgi:hypothetical protein
VSKNPSSLFVQVVSGLVCVVILVGGCLSDEVTIQVFSAILAFDVFRERGL